MTSRARRRSRPPPTTLFFGATIMAGALALSLSCLTKGGSTIIKRRSAPAFLLLPRSPCSLHVAKPSTTSCTTLHGRGGGAGRKGEDKLSKGKKKGDLPEKTCVVCGRPFTWRAKWAKVRFDF